MRYTIALTINLGLILTLNSPCKAENPVKKCQIEKNLGAGKFTECQFEAESGKAGKTFEKVSKKCLTALKKSWTTTIKKTTKAKATCLDAKLTYTDYANFIKRHTNEIATLLGKDSTSLSKLQITCRSEKNIAAGKYEFCNFKAESKFTKSGNSAAYEKALNACAGKFIKSFEKIVSKTVKGNSQCFDSELEASSYQTKIEEHTKKVSKVIAGEGDFNTPTPAATSLPTTVPSPTVTFTPSSTPTATSTPTPVLTISGVSPSNGAASGGATITITGAGFTDTMDVSFGGVSANFINIVSDTTLEVISPPHANGANDVSVTTPSDTVTFTNGFTYQTTVIGDSIYGGTVACLNGGLSNLIAATVDNSNGIAWGGLGVTTNAQSNSDGATNTATIVTALGAGSYAASLCNDYEIDSQGNTPCQGHGICYNDWFLPAANQLDCLYTNRTAVGGFSTSSYLSSTELNSTSAGAQNFNSG